MAKKPTVTTLASGFNSTETLNANFEALRDSFDNTLSLDGSLPNAMEADLDLNSNSILNATAIMVGGSDVVATTAAALAAAVQAQIDADAAVVASALSETNAANSATASQTSADASQASRLAAETAETNAETAETNAETAAALATTNGAAQVALATTQAGLATTQAVLATTNGAAQVTLATTQATNAAGSAATATAQAVIATTKASEASASATQAAADVASIQGAAGAAVDAANSAAAAAAALDNFDDRYLGPKSSEPTVDNDGDALVSGALYFDSTSNAMQVYDGANWVAASASGVASMILYEYTATAGQTTFAGSDDNGNSISFIQGNEIVVFNGIILDPSDYNSTSGTSIVLNVGAALNDLINVYAFKSFTVADTVPASTGGTFGGDVTVTGTLAATTLTGDGSGITGLPAGYTDTDVATYLAGVGNVVVGGTVDGVDIAARDAILTSTTTTASAALPKSGGAMTGAITTNSTFDGRDVAADGTKLDGIETGATADQTAAQLLTAVKTVDGSGSGLDADTVDGVHESTFMRRSANSQLDMNNNDIVGVDQIIHEGDTDTYMQFHAADQWRVVTGGAERLEVNNSQITSTEPIYAPSFHGNGSALTGIASGAGTVKAWVNWNQQGTQSIRLDGNVSSITDNGTGRTTISFSSVIGTSSYSLSGAATLNTVRTAMIGPKQSSTYSTSAVFVHCQSDSGNFTDSQIASIQVTV